MHKKALFLIAIMFSTSLIANANQEPADTVVSDCNDKQESFDKFVADYTALFDVEADPVWNRTEPHCSA